MLDSLTSLLTLTLLEVVLSIDNLVVIAVLVGKLPKERQAAARPQQRSCDCRKGG